MSKYQIVFIVTLLLITAPFILSQDIRCYPPYNFLLKGKCVSECGIDYVVIQGTFDCILRSECINKFLVSKFGEQYFPYCIQDPPQISDNFISSENECPKRNLIKSYVTGTCLHSLSFDQLTEIGVFNQAGNAFFSKSLIKEILQKSNITIQEQFKNVFDQHCELIDSTSTKCITKNDCIKKRFNISSGDCVEICQNDLISHEYKCKSNEDINPNLLQKNSDNTWVLKQTCFHFRKNDECFEKCAGKTWIDFSTGFNYCNYEIGDYLQQSNKVNLLKEIIPDCPISGSKDCFKFCIKDSSLKSETISPLYQKNNQFLEVCEEKHNIQFGIFHIAQDDCPYYISNQQCVKQCEKGFKWIQRKNFKECIPCKRVINGHCSDHCMINRVYLGSPSQMCEPKSGIFTFQFDDLDFLGHCHFPKMLSENQNNCVDECNYNQIPSQINGQDGFKCIQNTDLEIPSFQLDYYLSSDKRRYVVKCNDINEIQCKNTCIQRSEQFGLKSPCDWKINQELQFIQAEKGRLLQNFQSPEFMEKNIKWYFHRIKIEDLTIKERISLLAQMTYLSMEFLQKYAEYADYYKGQFILDNYSGSILIKVAVIPQKGGLFKTEINFNNSLKSNTIEIEPVETIMMQTLSLTHYNSEYVICTSENSCSFAEFIVVQMIMQEESSEIEPEFQIEFNINEVKGEETDNGKKYICFDGRIGEEISQSLRTDAQLNGDNENVSSITCKGKQFIGYYYGTQDDTIFIKRNEQFELRQAQKDLHRGQEKLKNERKNLDEERKSFEREKYDSQNQIDLDRKKLNSDRAAYETLKNTLTSDQGKLTDDQGQLAKDQGKLVDDQGQLAKDQGKLTDDQGQLAKDQGKLADDQGQLAKDQGKLADDQGKLQEKLNELNLPKKNHPEIVNGGTDESANQDVGTVTNETEIANERTELNEEKANLLREKNYLKSEKAKLASDQQQLRAKQSEIEKEKNLKKVYNQQQVENKSGSNLTQTLLIVAVSVLGGIIIIYIIYKLVFK